MPKHAPRASLEWLGDRVGSRISLARLDPLIVLVVKK